MKNQINWKEIAGGHFGEGAVDVNTVNYRIMLSETHDNNGPYFNITKTYNNGEHYYNCDIDGAGTGECRADYTHAEAKERCEKDYALATNKDALEWFYAHGGETPELEQFTDSLLIEYTFNHKDRSEYLIYSDLHQDGISDEEAEERRCYMLVKLEKNGAIREFEKGYLSYERCKELAAADFLASEITRGRE